MKEPNVQKQKADSYQQYKDGLITLAEHKEQLARISRDYGEWAERNKGGQK